MTFHRSLYIIPVLPTTGDTICGGGGTGRRARLRGVWATIRVQVPFSAPYRVFITDLSYEHSFFMFYQQAPRLLFFMPGCTPQQRPAVFVQHNALSAALPGCQCSPQNDNESQFFCVPFFVHRTNTYSAESVISTRFFCLGTLIQEAGGAHSLLYA